MSPDQQPNDPLFHPPFQEPNPAPTVVTSPTGTPPAPESGGQSKSRLLLFIVGAAVLELLIIIGLAIAVATNSNTPATTATKDDAKNSQAEGPTAATSSSVQLIDDSITQDLSTLNDDKDFPADKFSDRSLNL